MTETNDVPGPKLVIEGPLTLTQDGTTAVISRLTIRAALPSKRLFFDFSTPATARNLGVDSKLQWTIFGGSSISYTPPSGAPSAFSFPLGSRTQSSNAGARVVIGFDGHVVRLDLSLPTLGDKSADGFQVSAQLPDDAADFGRFCEGLRTIEYKSPGTGDAADALVAALGDQDGDWTHTDCTIRVANGSIRWEYKNLLHRGSGPPTRLWSGSQDGRGVVRFALDPDAATTLGFRPHTLALVFTARWDGDPERRDPEVTLEAAWNADWVRTGAEAPNPAFSTLSDVLDAANQRATDTRRAIRHAMGEQPESFLPEFTISSGDRHRRPAVLFYKQRCEMTPEGVIKLPNRDQGNRAVITVLSPFDRIATDSATPPLAALSLPGVGPTKSFKVELEHDPNALQAEASTGDVIASFRLRRPAAPTSPPPSWSTRLGALGFSSFGQHVLADDPKDGSSMSRLLITTPQDRVTSAGAGQLAVGVEWHLRLDVGSVTPEGIDRPWGDRDDRRLPLIVPQRLESRPIDSPGSAASAEPRVTPPAGPPSPAANDPVQPPFVLVVDESVGPGQDRWLRATLLENSADSGDDGSVSTLLSFEPWSVLRFTRRRLDRLGDAENAAVAIFDGDQRTWRVKQATPEYAFEFPVQGVGESADKPGMLEIHDLSGVTSQPFSKDIIRPNANEPIVVLRPAPSGAANGDAIERRFVLETRFGPSLELWVKPSDLDRNYILPEWQAHEIFRRRNDFGLGVALRAARGEFLYGLSFGVDVSRERGQSALARVAEIEALTGKLPPLLLNPTPSARQTSLIERWRKLRRALLQRSERIELWTPAYDQIRPFVHARFEGGATFALRTTALHRYPLPDHSQRSATAPDERRLDALRFADHGLPGGALWPMESLAILSKVAFEKPTPTGGTIERIAICPGGGDADQAVEFANGYVTIASQTRAGFLQRQKIEVLGRIGVFWHRAKHVIVYERTVNPSEQFAPLADEAGWHKTRSRRALVRKVSEYIEILQPCRSYPDIGPAEGTDCGFLDSVRFNTRIIHVDGSWKTEWAEIGDQRAGYKIPLWNAGAAEQRPNVYPLPSVSAVTLGEGKEKRPLVPRQIANPENLFFFTQKPPDRGSESGPCDPDSWDPFFGVDYGNVVDPAALERLIAPGGDGYGPPGSDKFAQGRKPSTPRVLPGYNRFTWRLLPDGKRTALNAGFCDKPVYGDLDSITFSRGMADEREETTLLRAAASNPVELIAHELNAIASEGDVAKQVTKAKECLERLNTLKDAFNSEQLNKDICNLFESPIDCHKLRGLVDEVVSKKRLLIQTMFRDWALTASQWTKKQIDDAVTRSSKKLRAITADLLGVKQMAEDLLGDVETGVGSLRADIARTRRAVTDCVNTLRTHVAHAATRLDAALDAADRDLGVASDSWPKAYAATRLIVVAEIDTLRADIEAETDETLRRISLESSPLAQKMVEQLKTALDNFLKDVIDAVFSNVGVILPDPKTSPVPEAGLVFSKCRAAVATLREKVDPLESVLTEKLNTPVNEIKGVLDGTDVALLRHLRTFRDAASDFIAETAILGKIRESEVDLNDMQGYKAVCDEVSSQFSALAADIDNWAEAAVTGYITVAGISLSEACTKVDDWKKSLLPEQHEISELRNSLVPTKAIGRIEAIANAGANAADVATKVADAQKELADIRKLAKSAPALAAAYRARVSEALSDINHGGPKPGKILALMSAAAQAPEIGQMQANIDRMRCSYKKAQIETSKAMAAFSKLGQALKALGIELPFNGLGNQLTLSDAELARLKDKFDLQRLLPDFGGIKLDGLLGGVKLPETPEAFREAVKVRHDFDKVHFRAWAQIDVNMPIKGRKKLFGIGPMTMYFRDSLLTGSVRAEASKDDADASTTGAGLIETNIDVDVSGELIVSLEQVRIEYSKEKKLHVDFDPRRIRLHSAMQFVQDTFGDLIGDEIGGLTIVKEKGFPVGLEHQFKLPVMSLMAGTSGISNIQMSNAFRLLAYPDFVISNRFCLSRPELPFIFTFFILGGTGYVIVDSRYRPFDKALTVEVEAAIGGAAALGISAGAISGQVFITLSVALAYRKTFTGDGTSGDGLSVAAVLVVAGNVNIAGIVDVYIGVMLRLTYREGGAIDGVGTVTVEVKISVFFTFKFRSEMTLRMRGGRTETTRKIETSAESGKAVDTLKKRAEQLANTRA